MAKIQDRIFLLTDYCVWEKNKKDCSNSPHSIEVVDTETGQVRYIASGSKIKFVSGDIKDRNQEDLNNKT